MAWLGPDSTVEESIEHADRAMYQAKAAGRDQVVVWSGHPPAG